MLDLVDLKPSSIEIMLIFDFFIELSVHFIRNSAKNTQVALPSLDFLLNYI